jgi:hypothetical protein
VKEKPNGELCDIERRSRLGISEGVKMRNYIFVICLAVVLFPQRPVCAEAVRMAKCPKGTIDVYGYWPWLPGTVWTGREMSRSLFPARHTVKSLPPDDGAPIRVLWDGDWMDYYKETGNGLERYKDFSISKGIYGEYHPAAVQYPRCTRLGEVYYRKVRRTDRRLRDNSTIASYDEEMTYVATRKEDITVSGRTYKDCLVQVRDFKDIRGNGSEHRKINISWNANGVGMVRGCLIEFVGGRMIENFCADLSSVRVSVP